MEKILVDITSLYGVLAYLTGDVKDGSSWARENYLDITVFLLKGHELVIPLPPADQIGPAFELYRIRDFVLDLKKRLGAETKKDASAFQENCLKNNGTLTKLKTFLEEMMDQNKRQLDSWVKWHRKREWWQHIRRCQGLVEKENVRNVATLLSVCKDGIEEVNIEEVNTAALAPDFFSKAPSEFHAEAWVADILVRGLYYEAVAKKERMAYWPHQSRRMIASNDGKQEERKVGYVPFLIAELIRKSTDGAQSRSGRVERWLELANQAQAASPATDLFAKNMANKGFWQAIGSAHSLARKLELRSGSPRTNKAADIAVALATAIVAAAIEPFCMPRVANFAIGLIGGILLDLVAHGAVWVFQTHMIWPLTLLLIRGPKEMPSNIAFFTWEENSQPSSAGSAGGASAM